MEKSLLLSNFKEAEIRRAGNSSPQIRSKLRLCAGLVLGLLGIVAFVLRYKLIASKPIHVQDLHESHVSWDDITPTASLEFHPCFGNFECARLDVPLDWSPSSQSKQRAAVALIRIPAKVPVTDPRYGGAVLINPGGPGGSGVVAAIFLGRQAQTVVDSPSDPKMSNSGKYFDIIGFDPRGINNTTPTTSCFPDDTSRILWQLLRHTEGIVSNTTFPYVWSRIESFSEGCSKRMNDPEDYSVGKFVNTPVVVEDMIAIVEALGEWREKSAKRELRKQPISERQAIIERTKWRKGQERVLYWGFSYGTLLGATLASMHPDRLERIALDGVVDAEDYYKGEWLTNLQDTNLIIERFHEDCYSAGPEKCLLWGSSGPDHSRTIFDRVLNQLEDSPLPVPAFGSFGPEIITYTDVMTLVRAALYQPRGWFSIMARLFAALDQGNGAEIAAIKQMQFGVICKSPLCTPWRKDCGDPDLAHLEAGHAILCSDAPDHTNWTAERHYEKYLTLMGQSKYLGAAWSEITMDCANWHVRPSWEYIPTLESNTSNPILWISNSRDPVTPLRNAVKMAKGFTGSAILTQDADGHCSLSAPSLCMAKWIRNYFQDGELPPEGLMCEPDFGTFDFGYANFPPAKVMSKEDEELSEALEKLSYGFGGGPLGI